jgi:tRNA pseudouridine-54 N-methylase
MAHKKQEEAMNAQPHVEIAVYLTQTRGGPHQIWVQLSDFNDRALEDQVKQLLAALSFSKSQEAPSPGLTIYSRSFTDLTQLVNIANRLIRQLRELPLRRSFRFCLPNEDNQIFLPEF